MTSKKWLVLTTLVAVAVYVVAWIGWSSEWAWVVEGDGAALDATHRFGLAHPGWITFWNVLCSVFSPLTFRVLVLGLIVWAMMRRRWRLAVFLFFGVQLAGVVTELGKGVADRPRPATALVYASSTSFPSGHALSTMVAVLALLVVALPLVRRSGTRWGLIGAGVVIVIAVGVGRVMLNVHNPSDVMAGWALGYVWFVACLPLLPRVRAADETPATRDSSP